MGKLIFYALFFVSIWVVVWLDGRYDLLGRFESLFDDESVQPSPSMLATPTVDTLEDSPEPHSSSDVPFVYMPNQSSGTDDFAIEFVRNDMLKLIYDARNQAGVPQVSLGNNQSPQACAESMGTIAWYHTKVPAGATSDNAGKGAEAPQTYGSQKTSTAIGLAPSPSLAAEAPDTTCRL